MKTIKAEIIHAGPRAVAVPIVGGSLTVWPQDKLTGVDILPVSKEREELYKTKGVTFVFGRASSPRKAGGSSQPVNIAALEKVLLDAKSAYELAHQAASKDEATDADHQALQQAIDAVEDAEKNLEQAKK